MTDANIDTIWDAYFSERITYDQDVLDMRYQFKDHIMREEW